MFWWHMLQHQNLATFTTKQHTTIMSEKSARDEIRCVHGETGRVEFVKRYICENKNWQISTGFVPQEIEPIGIDFVQSPTDQYPGESNPTIVINNAEPTVVKSETHVVEINEPNISNESLDELVDLNENGADQTKPKPKRTYNKQTR